MKRVVTITINTDASFHPEYKLGGYAFYIICDRFKVRHSGKFNKIQPRNSQEAEMMCIDNAMSYLLSMEQLPKSKYLIINTDCKTAMEQIRRRQGELGSDINRTWQRLIHRVGSKKNEFRHVKAHSHTDDARSWVNSWCDDEAKKHMREQVKGLRLIEEQKTICKIKNTIVDSE